jgi:protein-disulfide isomerase
MRPSRRQLVAAAALGLVLPTPLLAAPARSQPLPDDMSLGNPDARVTVIEYASASCPHCAHFNNEVFPAFKAKYIDTFLIARCAGRDKYFSVLDSIFRGQEQMYATGDVKGTLLKAAQGAGMNEAQVDACLTDEIAGDQLNARVQRYAKDDGINVTPTFVVNGKKLEGVQTLAQLDAAIAAAQGRHPG